MAARRDWRLTPALEKFEGMWRLTRQVQHADGVRAQFSGEAQFLRQEDGLLYIETGQLVMQGHSPMQAERRYLWRAGARGGFDVFFDDGRPFHEIGPQSTKARHFCDPDIYDVAYDFDTWPDWRCRWQVKGPRKDYVMESRYQPADDFPKNRDSAP